MSWRDELHLAMSNQSQIEVAAPVESAKPKTIKFRVGKDHLRRFEFPNGENITIYHLYPTLAEWMGKEIPDDVNPRSHDLDMVKSGVAKEIRRTLEEAPGDFFLANRGATVIAESLRFDPARSEVEIVIADPDIHGLADGATSDAVIALVQQAAADGRSFKALTHEEIPAHLKEARFHVEVIVGITGREKIGIIARGRNTSRQVKSWSLADFKGAFDWISNILEKSPAFAGRIGYEEKRRQGGYGSRRDQPNDVVLARVGRKGNWPEAQGSDGRLL